LSPQATPMEKRPSKAKARILIADHEILFRDGLRMILEQDHGFSVVGVCESAPETQRMVKRLKPDVLLLNYGAPKFLAAEVLRRLQSNGQKVCSIVLADEIDSERMDELLRLGVSGIILKDSAKGYLAQCIRGVMAGFCLCVKTACPRQQLALIAAKIQPKNRRPENFALTPREMDVLANIVAGKSNRELAESFSISEQTVKHHLTNIFDKVGVYNRLELALFAIHHQLIPKR
jgi:two-component system, NarL family, nitrate/nitrite response regulator NarL